MEGPLEQVVIDANIAVALAVELPYSSAARARIAAWQAAQSGIYVPVLWEYEVASALRKAVHAGLLAPDEAGRALEILLQMNLERVEPDLALHQAALRWAECIGQIVAYDAQYLALAERLGAEFWTADRRLAERARECGANWVRLI